jgi:hypothetical protein
MHAARAHQRSDIRAVIHNKLHSQGIQIFGELSSSLKQFAPCSTLVPVLDQPHSGVNQALRTLFCGNLQQSGV